MLQDASPLEQSLQGLWPGLVVEVLDEIDSTNSELMRRARDGRRGATLLVARVQTAGRGRLGRAWHSGTQGLCFSLGLPLSPASWAGLSLAVGVSLARSLHPCIQLKWPNDLWLAGRKLGGILVETLGAGHEQPFVVIGVGLNLWLPDAGDLSSRAAALSELVSPSDMLHADHVFERVFERISAPLVQAVLAFEQLGFAPFRSEFLARDALAGQVIDLSDGSQGEARGVNESGALLVHTLSGMRQITSSEISVRANGAATPARGFV